MADELRPKIIIRKTPATNRHRYYVCMPMLGRRAGSLHPGLESMGELPFTPGYTRFMHNFSRIIQRRNEAGQDRSSRSSSSDSNNSNNSNNSNSTNTSNSSFGIPEMPKMVRIKTSLKVFKFVQNHMHRFHKEQAEIGEGHNRNPPWIRHPASYHDPYAEQVFILNREILDHTYDTIIDRLISGARGGSGGGGADADADVDADADADADAAEHH